MLTPFFYVFVGSAILFMICGVYCSFRQDKYGAAGVYWLSLLWMLYVITLSLMVVLFNIRFCGG